MIAAHIRTRSPTAVIFGVIAAMTGFAAGAYANPGPSIHVTGATLNGTGFTPGSQVFLGAYQPERGSSLRRSTYVTAEPEWAELCGPTGICHRFPNHRAGTFSYTLPGELLASSYCFGHGRGSISAYDRTLGWSNSIDFRECIF